MKPKKLLLISKGVDNSSRTKTITYTLYVLNSYLQKDIDSNLKDQVTVEILDFDFDTSIAEMTNTVLSKEPDIVAFSVYLWNYNELLSCCKKVKANRADVVTILGGPQVSPIASEVITTHSFIDIIASISINGEIVFLNIIEAILNNNIESVNGIIFRDKNDLIIETSKNIESLCFETSPSPYTPDSNIFSEDIDYMAIIETSRGCHMDCGYCFFNNNNGQINYFSLERVFNDIEYIYNHPKVKYVFFCDSNILINKERFKKIINHIQRQKFNNIPTSFELNSLFLDEDSAKLLTAQSGLPILIAIQTTNKNALELISKRRPAPEVFLKKIKSFKEKLPDIKFCVDLMLGLPGDDLNSYFDTLDYVLSFEPDQINLQYPIYLLPGTRFYNNMDAYGISCNTDPPLKIIETKLFPKKDIETAIMVSTYIQILLSYYPVISNLFFNLMKKDSKRFDRLINWIKVIESKLILFPSEDSIVDGASQSHVVWNKLKKNILRKAAMIKNAVIIFDSITDIENIKEDNSISKEFMLAHSLIRYLNHKHLEIEIPDDINIETFNNLPTDIIDGVDFLKFKTLFSKYRD